MKLIGTFAGTGAAIAGLIVSVPPAWSSLGLPEAASRAYVLDKLDTRVKPLEVAQNTTTAAVDRLVLIQLKQSLYDAQKDPAASTSPIVQERIAEITAEINRTEARVNASGQGR
jgi:aminopeptidase N